LRIEGARYKVSGRIKLFFAPLQAVAKKQKLHKIFLKLGSKLQIYPQKYKPMHSEKTIQLGFSPCPNDTFIFDALVHGRIDTEGYRFEPILADVEQLNQMAAKAALPMTKLSYHAYYHVQDRYILLNSGSALGRGCGPLLIGAKPWSLAEVAQADSIWIPGERTTANFLLHFAFPKLRAKIEPHLFSEIEQAVLEAKAALGLIIHENRFTYAQKGLHKVLDLGEYWEQETGYAIPLGGIAIRRDLPIEEQQTLQRLMQRSVAYAFAHPQASRDYVCAHAQEMDPAVQAQHIALYVNEHTQDLGTEGRAAVQYMMQHLQKWKQLWQEDWPLFVD
jgi:1,4-dihydroxy-6-naphthoate synthase